MKKEILKRLGALESQRIKNQKAAEREAFLNAASRIVPAYYLGGLKPKEFPGRAMPEHYSFRTLTVFFERLHKRYRLEMHRNSEAAITMPFVDYFQSLNMTVPRRRRLRRQSSKWQIGSRRAGELGLLNWWKK